MVITGTDTESVGVAYGGDLLTVVGDNQKDFEFDTSLFIPGRYTLHFKLYKVDVNGNAEYYDQCVGIKFNIEHTDDSLDLKHWFKDWGYAVLPCVEQVEE